MSAVFLQLQSMKQQAVSIMPNTIFKFENTVVPSDISKVLYNPSTGKIYLYQTGTYYVSWFVAVNIASGPLEFQLVTSDSRSISSYSPRQMLMQDQLTGSAIIKVDQPGLELSLQTGSSVVSIANVPVTANLVIHSLDEGESGESGDTPSDRTTVNFSNGAVDPTNPLTWPLIFEMLQLSWLRDRSTELQQIITPSGLEELLGLPPGTLGILSITNIISSAIATCQTALADLLSFISERFFSGERGGLLSMDAYIGHSTVGIVPAIAGGDLPVLSLLAGPPYPQIISRSGVITSFAAGYGALAELDISLTGFIPGVLNTLNGLISIFSGGVTTLANTLGSISSILAGLGAPLPGDYAEIMNNLILSLLNDGAAPTNLHMHSVLWRGTKDQSDVTGKEMNWQEVSDLDLGPIQFLGLGPINSALAGFGAIISAGANVISSLLALLTSRGTPDQGLNSEPLNTNINPELNFPISAGDYLMVQFTLKGEDNTTLLAGVLASNLIASVTIQ